MRLRIVIAYRTMDGVYGRLTREMDDFSVTNTSLQRIALTEVPRQSTLLQVTIQAQQPTFDDWMLNAVLGGHGNSRGEHHVTSY